MRIERAYCIELKKVVDIIQAQEAFFTQMPPRSRLNFLCSDPDCWQVKVKVTGVAYDRLVEDTEKYVAPHFRENPRTPHLPNCEWVELEEAIQALQKEIDAEPESEESIRIRNLKATDWVDVFDPKFDADEDVNTVRDSIAVTNVRVKTASKGERIRMIKQALRKSLTKSSFLQKVVSAYEQMDVVMRKTSVLEIVGVGKLRFSQAFKRVSWAAPQIMPRIFFGNATVRKYGNNFAITFFDKATWDGHEKRVSIYLTGERLSTYRHRVHLIELLESAEEKAHYAACYFFGNLIRAEKPGWLNAQIDHLDSLVVIVRSKQRK
ncbi:MAG: hypothetical protein IDH49_08615 [Gammaproteobacteria bacterium]|nr:hypothetical protein [Gammaproteobacteria bacterium]